VELREIRTRQIRGRPIFRAAAGGGMARIMEFKRQLNVDDPGPEPLDGRERMGRWRLSSMTGRSARHVIPFLVHPQSLLER